MSNQRRWARLGGGGEGGVLQEKTGGRVPFVGKHGDPVAIDVAPRSLISHWRIGINGFQAGAAEGLGKALCESAISVHRVNITADSGFNPPGFAGDGSDADLEAQAPKDECFDVFGIHVLLFARYCLKADFQPFFSFVQPEELAAYVAKADSYLFEMHQAHMELVHPNIVQIVEGNGKVKEVTCRVTALDFLDVVFDGKTLRVLIFKDDNNQISISGHPYDLARLCWD